MKQKGNIIEFTRAVSGRVVRLTFKQWFHIIESHDYMAGNIDIVLETVHAPDYIVKGLKGEFIALRHYSRTNLGEKYCVVVYKENREGFIITAFLTSRPNTIKKRGVLWRR